MQLTKSNLSLPPHTCPPQLSYLKYFPFLQKIQVKVDSCPRVMGLAECLALRAGTVAPAPSSVRPNVPLICDMGRDGARVVRVKRIPGVKAWPFCGAQDTPPPAIPPPAGGDLRVPREAAVLGKGCALPQDAAALPGEAVPGRRQREHRRTGLGYAGSPALQEGDYVPCSHLSLCTWWGIWKVQKNTE